MECSQLNLALVQIVQFKMFTFVINSIVYILAKQVVKKPTLYHHAGCKETNIPSCFPHPMLSRLEIIAAVNTTPAVKSPIKTVFNPTIPPKPHKLPYPATYDNVPKLEQYLKDAFKDTTFNRSPLFPVMTGLQAHIHLKPDAIPYARRAPITVPYNRKDQIKDSLEWDVERGIITHVPIGTPVTWFSPMVITTKIEPQIYSI